MRLAFMTFSRPDLDWPAVLALADEHGYDRVLIALPGRTENTGMGFCSTVGPSATEGCWAGARRDHRPGRAVAADASGASHGAAPVRRLSQRHQTM